jgi:hypothetical protein
MKIETTRGYGKVVNPVNGEEIDVEGIIEVDSETYEALKEKYSGFRIVDDKPRGSGSEDGGAETYECGINGCSRNVDGPNETCWQHED